MYRTILKYLKSRDWVMIAVYVVLVTFTVYIEFEIPGYMSEITTDLTQVEAEGDQMTDMNNDEIMMVLCAFGSLMMSILVSIIFAYIAA